MSLSKLTVNLIKTAPKVRSIAFFSTTKPATACGNEAERKKDWKLEVATKCDNKDIIGFVERNFYKEDALYRSLICNQKPQELRDMFQRSLDHGLSVIARNICSNNIVGVSINDRACKDDGCRLAGIGSKSKDCSVKKLFQTLSVINMDPKLCNKVCCDELVNVGSVLSVCEKHWNKGIGLGLIQDSLHLAKNKNFQFAKMNCTNNNTINMAEKLNMEKVWCAAYKDIMCRGIKPKALPDPPHTNVNVFLMNLKNLCSKC